MKKTVLLLTAATVLISSNLSFAGDTMPMAPSSKFVAPLEEPLPPLVYGTGFYVGVQAGINAYQDYGGTRRFSIRSSEVAVEPNENIGFVGGVKAGYVFGTGRVRPAIEADLFYNGIRADVDVRVNGEETDFNADADINSGAFLANFMVRFAFDRFQPYIGAGIGGYYAEVGDVDITVADRNFEGKGGSNAGLAWQLLGGADYYFNEKFSLFAEYKFLNYEDPDMVQSQDRISQHLVVLGLRWHF